MLFQHLQGLNVEPGTGVQNDEQGFEQVTTNQHDYPLSVLRTDEAKAARQAGGLLTLASDREQIIETMSSES